MEKSIKRLIDEAVSTLQAVQVLQGKTNRLCNYLELVKAKMGKKGEVDMSQIDAVAVEDALQRLLKSVSRISNRHGRTSGYLVAFTLSRREAMVLDECHQDLVLLLEPTLRVCSMNTENMDFVLERLTATQRNDYHGDLKSDMGTLRKHLSRAKSHRSLGAMASMLESEMSGLDDEEADQHMRDERLSHALGALAAAAVHAADEETANIDPKSLKIFYNEKIGVGPFGPMVRGRWRSHSVAVVRLVSGPSVPVAAQDELRKTVERWKKLHNRHLCQVYGTAMLPEGLCAVQECCDVNLLDYISAKNRTGGLSKQEIGTVIKALARALFFLHSHNVIHGDVRPANIWLSEGLGVVKLSGLTADKERASDAQLAFRAPECHMNPPQWTSRADVYSFALTCWELTYGKRVHLLQSRPVVTSDGPMEPWLRKLVQKCWNRDPNKRPFAPELLNTVERALTSRRSVHVVRNMVSSMVGNGVKPKAIKKNGAAFYQQSEDFDDQHNHGKNLRRQNSPAKLGYGPLKKKGPSRLSALMGVRKTMRAPRPSLVFDINSKVKKTNLIVSNADPDEAYSWELEPPSNSSDKKSGYSSKSPGSAYTEASKGSRHPRNAPTLPPRQQGGQRRKQDQKRKQRNRKKDRPGEPASEVVERKSSDGSVAAGSLLSAALMLLDNLNELLAAGVLQQIAEGLTESRDYKLKGNQDPLLNAVRNYLLDEEAQTWGLVIIRLLSLGSHGKANQEILFEAGMHYHVLICMRTHPASPMVQANSCVALYAFLVDKDGVVDEDRQHVLMNAGACNDVLSALKTHRSNSRVVINGCWILIGLTSHNQRVQTELQAGNAFSIVLKCMNAHMEEPAVLEHGGGALWNMAENNLIAQRGLYKAGAVPILVRAMKTNLPEMAVQENALGTLREIVNGNESKAAQIAKGGVATLIPTVLAAHSTSGPINLLAFHLAACLCATSSVAKSRLTKAGIMERSEAAAINFRTQVPVMQAVDHLTREVAST